MDYNQSLQQTYNPFINNYQVTDPNYLSLVNMLATKISPTTRKQILDNLTEFNDRLLQQESNAQEPTFNVSDIARSSSFNSRKKDLSEIQHPSFSTQTINQYQQPQKLYQYQQPQQQYQQPQQQYQQLQSQQQQQQYNPTPPAKNNEIDLNDILDDLTLESDTLDDKLDRIKTMYSKIITDKRRRRREREREKK